MNLAATLLPSSYPLPRCGASFNLSADFRSGPSPSPSPPCRPPSSNPTRDAFHGDSEAGGSGGDTSIRCVLEGSGSFSKFFILRFHCHKTNLSEWNLFLIPAVTTTSAGWSVPPTCPPPILLLLLLVLLPPQVLVAWTSGSAVAWKKAECLDLQNFEDPLYD